MTATATAPNRSVTDKPWPGMLLAAIGIAYLGAILPMTTVPGIRFNEAASVLALLLVVYAGVRLSLLLVDGRARLLECAFWTFTYSFLVLPLLAQVTARTYPLPSDYSYGDSTFVSVEIFIIVGLIGYEVGRVFALRTRNGHKSSPNMQRRFATALQFEVSTVRAALIGYIGLAFVLYTVARHGIAPLFTSRDEQSQLFLGPAPVGVKYYLVANKSSGLAVRLLNQVPVFVGALLLMFERHRRKPGSRGRPSWWLILPLLIGNVLINNPIGNSRDWYATVLLGLVSIYVPLRDRRWAARGFVIVFVLITLFSFQQLAAFRRTGGANFSSQSLSSSLVSSLDYASPQQMLNGIEYVEQNGYQLGRQLVGSVFVWVPRSVWPNKPGDTGDLVENDANQINVSAPLWTEGQVDFGVIGTFSLLALAGFAAAKLQRQYTDKTKGASPWVALVPPFASIFVFVLRGSLQPALGNGVIPFLIIAVLCMRRVRQGTPTESAVAGVMVNGYPPRAKRR